MVVVGQIGSSEEKSRRVICSLLIRAVLQRDRVDVDLERSIVGPFGPVDVERRS